MGLSWYLAMTGAEIAGYDATEKAAWMSCHFSHTGTGLSNLPRQLPEDTLVILDDSVPLDNHDPEKIIAQLCQIPSMSGLLLDFQRPAHREIYALIDKLFHGLPCPVAVTECCARGTDCPVFLSSPLNIPLEAAVCAWQGRALWLDIPFGSQRLPLTKDGCHTESITPAGQVQLPLWDEHLQCSYQIEIQPDRVHFTLHRAAGAVAAILEQADALGIQKAVSLRQEYLSNP